MFFFIRIFHLSIISLCPIFRRTPLSLLEYRFEIKIIFSRNNAKKTLDTNKQIIYWIKKRSYIRPIFFIQIKKGHAMCENSNENFKLKNPLPQKVTWEDMKADLMGLPKETLVEMVNMWLRNYWTLQNYWMIFIERDFGFDDAARLDGEIWEKLARAQAGRLKKLLNLGGTTQDLALALKYTAPQWAPAGFDWQFRQIEPDRVFMEVNQCPMGTYRDAQGLERLPCKLGSDGLYQTFAQTINPKFTARCLHAHPDPPIEGVMCRWEFCLSD